MGLKLVAMQETAIERRRNDVDCSGDVHSGIGRVTEGIDVLSADGGTCIAIYPERVGEHGAEVIVEHVPSADRTPKKLSVTDRGP